MPEVIDQFQYFSYPEHIAAIGKISGMVVSIPTANQFAIKKREQFLRDIDFSLLKQVLSKLFLIVGIRINSKFVHVAGQVDNFYKGMGLFYLQSGSQNTLFLFCHPIDTQGKKLQFH